MYIYIHTHTEAETSFDEEQSYKIIQLFKFHFLKQLWESNLASK